MDFAWLAECAPADLREEVLQANTAQHVLELCGDGIAQFVAAAALGQVQTRLQGSGVVADVIVVDRAGRIIAHAG